MVVVVVGREGGKESGGGGGVGGDGVGGGGSSIFYVTVMAGRSTYSLAVSISVQAVRTLCVTGPRFLVSGLGFGFDRKSNSELPGSMYVQRKQNCT